MAPFAEVAFDAKGAATIFKASRLDARELSAIGLGGAAGALLRVWLSRRFAVGPADWPWATFAINFSGSLALAYLAAYTQRHGPRPSYARPLLGAGLCGTYTTFATVQLELLHMIDADRLVLAAAYVVASACAGYAAIVLGTAIARRDGSWT